MDTSPYEPGNTVHTLRCSYVGALLSSALDRVEGGVGDSLHAGHALRPMPPTLCLREVMRCCRYDRKLLCISRIVRAVGGAPSHPAKRENCEAKINKILVFS